MAPGRDFDGELELVQARIVTDDVATLAAFYAHLIGIPVASNDYYVEVPAGPASLGFARHRFTEHRDRAGRRDEFVLDFRTPDVDAQYRRIAALDVDWVALPTTQPWGTRSLVFRDPGGNLVCVFSAARPPSAAAPLP